MFLFLLQSADQTISWGDNVIAWATIVIAVSTVVSVIATILLWLTTKHAFEASHRPFLGIMGISWQTSTEPQRVVFNIGIQNAGSVPANDVQTSLRIVVDGIILPTDAVEEEETTIIIPSSSQTIVETIDDPKHCQAIVNATRLALLFKCTYKGVGKKKYVYEQKIAYNKERNSFGGVKGNAT